MRTLTQLLAIAGLGLILGTTHAIIRGAPGVTLRDITPASQPTGTATATDAGNNKQDPEPEAPPPTDSGAGSNTGTAPVADPTTNPPPVSESDPASIDPLDATVYPGQITLREAFGLFEQGAWFLDARSRDDFDAGTIEGAIWMPAFHASTNAGQQDLDIIAPGETVVIFCTGGDCDASKNTQRRLALLQYDFDVRILGKGYIDWVEAGLPTALPEQTGGGTP